MPRQAPGETHPAPGSGPGPRVVVLGVGGAGLRAATELAARPEAGWLAIAGVDPDQQALCDSGLTQTFAVGAEWTRGQGCGGDPQRGARALAHKSQKQVEDFLRGSALVFLVGGLGGGAATGGIPVLSRLARRLNLPAIALVTMPFSFEGHARRETAEEGLRQLVPDAEVVVPIPNDLLFANLAADTPAEESFRAADRSLAGAALSLAEILRCRSPLAADFAAFRTLLGRRKSCCTVGCGEIPEAGEGDPAQRLLEQLLASPLLNGTRRLAEADALVAVLSGGPGLSIGEMKQTLEALERQCRPDCHLVTGAATAPWLAGRRRLTVLAIQFDPDSAPATDPAALRPGPLTVPGKPADETELVQAEFPIFKQERGLFANTAPNLHDGVDLDVPTFQRQEITLDQGR